jgi:hypothetical protein
VRKRSAAMSPLILACVKRTLKSAFVTTNCPTNDSTYPIVARFLIAHIPAQAVYENPVTGSVNYRFYRNIHVRRTRPARTLLVRYSLSVMGALL